MASCNRHRPGVTQREVTMLITSVIASLLVGFLAGLLTFKVKVKWCSRCGSALSCVECRDAKRVSRFG